MFRKIAFGVAAAVAVTLAAGSISTKAEAAEFSITISNGYSAPVHNIHDRGHARRDHRHSRRDRGYRHGRHYDRRYDRRHGRRNGWRHSRYYDDRPRRRGRREVCHVHKKVVTFYDRYGTPHRKVKRHRTCEWVRR